MSKRTTSRNAFDMKGIKETRESRKTRIQRYAEEGLQYSRIADTGKSDKYACRNKGRKRWEVSEG